MEEELLRAFGNHLKILRKNYGLSQEALADKACLDRTYVSGVETGKRNISLRALNSIAKALDKNLSQLFEGM
ncbi:helix-turn-helix domain-containing protein [Alkanindiges illinoisensis]|uniref:helix-turn-helix domain-containing protein n=1 Tax=Alkanindiges illinoisensis TaxID=197183 RepID=UPI00047D920F|nr:helix-turn-helix transcriptional regulator [Alkanindiges illinoisensis]